MSNINLRIAVFTVGCYIRDFRVGVMDLVGYTNKGRESGLTTDFMSIHVVGDLFIYSYLCPLLWSSIP